MNNKEKVSEDNLFNKYFGILHDPRRSGGNHSYPISEILFLVISATVSGCTSWELIEEFGEDQIDWLKKYFPYENGTPSDTTLSDLFSVIDVKKFNTCFVDWVNSISELTEGDVVAIDGKCLRGSVDKAKNHPAFHLVSAYASDYNVCLSQEVVNDKSNEITAIPKLLDTLAIKGCIVIIDAMGCQKQIAKKIVKENKADYVIALKSNQKELQEQCEKLFKLHNTFQTYREEDSGHGRVETRECLVCNNLEFFDLADEWTTVRSFVKINRTRYDKATEKETKETQYYISSLDGTDAKKIGNAVRKHWAVENNLHWVLDVTFGEDGHKKRMGNSPVVFSMINKVAAALIKRNPKKGTGRTKRMKAAFNAMFREEVLGLKF